VLGIALLAAGLVIGWLASVRSRSETPAGVLRPSFRQLTKIPAARLSTLAPDGELVYVKRDGGDLDLFGSASTATRRPADLRCEADDFDPVSPDGHSAPYRSDCGGFVRAPPESRRGHRLPARLVAERPRPRW
jgi:hypothetical protein